MLDRSVQYRNAWGRGSTHPVRTYDPELVLAIHIRDKIDSTKKHRGVGFCFSFTVWSWSWSMHGRWVARGLTERKRRKRRYIYVSDSLLPSSLVQSLMLQTVPQTTPYSESHSPSHLRTHPIIWFFIFLFLSYLFIYLFLPWLKIKRVNDKFTSMTTMVKFTGLPGIAGGKRWWGWERDPY